MTLKAKVKSFFVRATTQAMWESIEERAFAAGYCWIGEYGPVQQQSKTIKWKHHKEKSILVFFPENKQIGYNSWNMLNEELRTHSRVWLQDLEKILNLKIMPGEDRFKEIIKEDRVVFELPTGRKIFND